MPISKTINIKQNNPTVEEARKKLIAELDKARSGNFKYVKIIHGYGSNGVGGVLGGAIRKSMKYRRKEKKIKDYIIGEKFSAFDSTCRSIIDKYPFLAKDADYNNNNFGITIVML
ncbi:MAG TPA: Smr/MutS family protein [Ignavibacteriaceae bacterium]|nr:Smr/MutS family protein [Ignavibacteriaceae bacterium]